MEDDVELCLEVQVDPASKKILSNPEKCRSTLLDVTVVKPKELEAFGTHRTNTLRADEVRKLLTSLEKQRRKKQKVLDKLKDDDTIIKIRRHDNHEKHFRPRKPFTSHRERISSKAPVDDLERKDFIGIAESVEPLFCEIRRSLKNVETRITDMQDINLEISQTTVDHSTSEKYSFTRRKKPNKFISSSLRNPSVYHVDTAPRDLKSILLCKNKQKYLERGDKPEGKCLCENCGVIGMLMECQKHPLLAELSESPPPSFHKRTRWNLPNVGDLNRPYNDFTYIDHLTTRVKLLEERLSAQEERIVPKDYFKKIITKMVTNLSPLFKQRSEPSVHCLDKPDRRRAQSERHSKVTRGTEKSQRCKSTEVCTCCTNKGVPRNSRKPHTVEKCTLTDEEMLQSRYAWKWGEEVLKPGVDLKNRIVSLVSHVLTKMSVNETLREPPKKNEENINYNSEGFQTFLKHVNSKVWNVHLNNTPPPLSPPPQNTYDRRQIKLKSFEPFHSSEYAEYYTKGSPIYHQHDVKRENYKDVDVSYVNPKLSLWRTQSRNACETDNKFLPKKKYSALGREEFLKIISKAKQHQKDVLWKNIWNQAVANGQTKMDKITIKIPCQNDDNKETQNLFETEISIGEVEKILTGS